MVRAGRSVRLYGVAAGACLDQCGVSGIRASPKPRLRDGQRRTMEQRSDELPEEAWREITVAEGSQGPRSYLFSAQRVRTDQQAQARRNPLGPSTAGTWTAANPATTCPMLRRIPRWRPWHTWEAPVGV